MRVVFALACILAVAAAAADLTVAGALTKGNNVALAAATGSVGSGAVGSILRIDTAVVKAAQGNQLVWWRAAAGCTAFTAAEKAQTVGWSDDGTNIVVYLDVSGAAAGSHLCASADITASADGTQAYVTGTTPIVFDAASAAAAGANGLIDASTGSEYYYGQTVTLTGVSAFAAGDALAIGDTFAVAKANMITWTAAGATATIKANGVATATYKVHGVTAANLVAGTPLNTLAVQQVNSADFTFEYKHATLNSTLTDVKVNGGAAETMAKANYTKGANFTFKLTNTVQGNDYMVVAVPKGKTCDELVTAGMFVNATQGATYSPTWWAKTVGVYEIYAKTYALDTAGKPTVACTKQMFGTVNIVEPPMPPPTPAPAPAPAPVAPAPAAAASTTGTSSASAIRGGLLAAFACVLAGLGVSAAF